jgi:hypothetical protein
LTIFEGKLDEKKEKKPMIELAKSVLLEDNTSHCIICKGVGISKDSTHRIIDTDYTLCKGCASMYVIQMKIRANSEKLMCGEKSGY